jgi:hypothetical protein
MPRGQDTRFHMGRQVGRDVMDMHNEIKEMQMESRERQARKHTQNDEEYEAYMDAYGNDGVGKSNAEPYCKHCGANENHPNHPEAPEHWSSYDPNFYPPEH